MTSTHKAARLGFIGQTLLAGATLALALAYPTAPELYLFLGAPLALVGFVLVSLAWLGTTAVFGTAGKVAGWSLGVGVGVGLLLMLVSESDREWGMMQGMVLGGGAVAIASAVGGIAAAVAFLRAKPPFTLAGWLYLAGAAAVAISPLLMQTSWFMAPIGAVLAASHLAAALAFRTIARAR